MQCNAYLCIQWGGMAPPCLVSLHGASLWTSQTMPRGSAGTHTSHNYMPRTLKVWGLLTHDTKHPMLNCSAGRQKLHYTTRIHGEKRCRTPQETYWKLSGLFPFTTPGDEERGQRADNLSGEATPPLPSYLLTAPFFWHIDQ